MKYFVIFHNVPADLGFILDKRPEFATKQQAEEFLEHYKTEFDCYGCYYDILN